MMMMMMMMMMKMTMMKMTTGGLYLTMLKCSMLFQESTRAVIYEICVYNA